MNLTALRLVTAATLLAAAQSTAFAADWDWTVTPYAWATDVGVDVEIDDHQVVDATIPVADLVEQLDATAQIHVEAQHGQHGLMLDLFYVHLADEIDGVALPAGGTAHLDTRIAMSIVELGGTFDPGGDREGLALLYGARVLDQRADIDARFDVGPGSALARTYEPVDTLTDALVGVRFVHGFSPRWSTESRVDASAGGTELTWSAGSTVSFAFGREQRYALLAGYRRMDVRFRPDGSLATEMTLAGALVGLRISL